MDESDRARAYKAFDQMVSANWRNGSKWFDLRIDRDFRGLTGTCRDYTLMGVVDGRREIVVASACRDGEGPWMPSG